MLRFLKRDEVANIFSCNQQLKKGPSVGNNLSPAKESNQKFRQNISSKSNCSEFVDTKMSRNNTIKASIKNVSVHCLVDIGAVCINLIDHVWLHSKLSSECTKMEPPRLKSATAANGSLEITGFIVLPICIKAETIITNLVIIVSD